MSRVDPLAQLGFRRKTAREIRKLENAQRRAYLARTPLPPGWLTRAVAAKALGVSLRTLDGWRAVRFGPPAARVGRQVVYSQQAVDVFRSFLPPASRRSKGHPIRLDVNAALFRPEAWDWIPEVPVQQETASVGTGAAPALAKAQARPQLSEASGSTLSACPRVSGSKTKTEKIPPGRGFGPGSKGRQMARKVTAQAEEEKARRLSVWEACGGKDTSTAIDPLAVVRRHFE